MAFIFSIEKTAEFRWDNFWIEVDSIYVYVLWALKKTPSGLMLFP